MLPVSPDRESSQLWNQELSSSDSEETSNTYVIANTESELLFRGGKHWAPVNTCQAVVNSVYKMYNQLAKLAGELQQVVSLLEAISQEDENQIINCALPIFGKKKAHSLPSELKNHIAPHTLISRALENSIRIDQSGTSCLAPKNTTFLSYVIERMIQDGVLYNLREAIKYLPEGQHVLLRQAEESIREIVYPMLTYYKEVESIIVTPSPELSSDTLRQLIQNINKTNQTLLSIIPKCKTILGQVAPPRLAANLRTSNLNRLVSIRPSNLVHNFYAKEHPPKLPPGISQWDGVCDYCHPPAQLPGIREQIQPVILPSSAPTSRPLAPLPPIPTPQQPAPPPPSMSSWEITYNFFYGEGICGKIMWIFTFVTLGLPYFILWAASNIYDCCKRQS